MSGAERPMHRGRLLKIPVSRQGVKAISISLLLFLGLCGKSAMADGLANDSYGGRDMIVYLPAHLPPTGARAMVVVLHGGLGNAQRIASAQSESALNMDQAADRYGFIVAYLNGTPVTLRLGPNVLGWNAGGGCCGRSAANNIDDVGYIKGAVGYLAGKYGVDLTRVYGIGHSNGAMMTQRLMCQTRLYAAGVAISGPLNLDNPVCSDARGKRILAIHGSDDQNVPIAGGPGSKGISDAVYKSEADSQHAFVAAGGAYDLEVVKGADHKLDDIAAVIQQTEGQTIAEKAARFFGLTGQGR
jgi:poly(3-hydroxybutyrate) depolymerase